MTTFVTETFSEEVDDQTAVEVHVSDIGEHWVGITKIANPKDWEFFPKWQFGKGEVGRQVAENVAHGFAMGLKFDLKAMAK